MNKTIINDPSPRTGVFEGDLVYGRMHGSTFEKGKDYQANRQNGVATNKPVAGLKLVEPRDPNCWKRDPAVKIAKKQVDRSQHHVNYLMQHWSDNHFMRLTVGRQRL